MKKRFPKWLVKILLKLKVGKITLSYESSGEKAEIDYDDIWLWTGYLRGKHAGRTVGDFIAEHFWEVKRYENFPNCWVVYQIRDWEDYYEETEI